MPAEDFPARSLPAPKRGGFFAGVRNAVMFFVALVGTAMAIGALLPFPNLGNLWRKYHHIEQHGDDYSIIYIGSSRVFHEFIPKQFDAELAAKGHQVKSFNFGQDGMWPPESFFMARKILTLRPPKLKYLLIDLMGMRGELDGNEMSARAVYWHDFRHTLTALQHVMEVQVKGQRTLREKLDRAWMHLDLFMQQSLNLGRFQEWFEVRLKLRPPKQPGRVPEEGFELAKEGQVVRKGPLKGAMLAEFERALRDLKKRAPRPLHPVMREALHDLIKECRAAGVEPIFVVASSLYGTERFRDWPPERVTVLRFDDPIAYPELYNPAERYDPHHLDGEGAKRFTSRLAEQFAHVIERVP